MTRRRGSAESGAALLEAVVALAAVATVVVGGTELHRATVAARLDAERTVAALTAASSVAERMRIGPRAGDGLDVVSEPVPTLWRRRGCDDGALVLHEVPLRPEGRSGPGRALPVALPPITDHVVLAVRTVTGDPAAVATVVATGADAATTTWTTDAAGCVALGSVSAPVTLVVTTPDGSIGRVAVASTDPAGWGTPSAAAAVPVTVAAAGRVTAIVATDGVLPDAVEGGRLAWWRGGAAGGPVAAPGESMDLPVGRHGVVLGACADARAGGSAAVVDVARGADAVLAVRVGVVVVARPAVDDGRRLVLRRQRPCPGAAARPTLVWDVGGGGGSLLAAVPDGEWEAVLAASDGRRLAGPATVGVSGDIRVAPPW